MWLWLLCHLLQWSLWQCCEVALLLLQRLPYWLWSFDSDSQLDNVPPPHPPFIYPGTQLTSLITNALWISPVLWSKKLKWCLTRISNGFDVIYTLLALLKFIALYFLPSEKFLDRTGQTFTQRFPSSAIKHWRALKQKKCVWLEV